MQKLEFLSDVLIESHIYQPGEIGECIDERSWKLIKEGKARLAPKKVETATVSPVAETAVKPEAKAKSTKKGE